MKKLIFIVALLIWGFSSLYSQGEWNQLSSPTTRTLGKVHFVDSLTGWAAGDSGIILRTQDGGQNWEIQNSTVNSEIRDVFFLNGDLGWAVSWTANPPFRTIILHTTDGGNSWTAATYPIDFLLMNTITFFDSLQGWMGGTDVRGGTPEQFLRTTNGGVDWEPVMSTGLCSGFPIEGFRFYSRQYGFANGGAFDANGVIWKTTDSGREWKAACVSPEPIQQLYSFDSLSIIGVGGDFEFGSGIVRTTNGGVSWEYRSLQVFGVAWSLSFRTAYEGWAPLGRAEKFIYTLDSGGTWTDIPTPNSSAIFDVQFTDSLHGYAVGYQGVILKYSPTPVNVRDNLQEYFPSAHRLYQNYPNPFNPRTKIGFQITDYRLGTLKVYDVLGQEVATLVNEHLNPGRYEIPFNASDLPTGVYFYRLELAGASTLRQAQGSAQGFVETKRMIYLK